jgi:hypothetical protein
LSLSAAVLMGTVLLRKGDSGERTRRPFSSMGGVNC